MAKRVFLHVGTPKTGTTYLQRLLWGNKQVLADQGLLLPLKNVRDHYYLSVLGRDLDKEEDRADLPPRALPLWSSMLDQVAGWDGDALISHELFAMTQPPKAEAIIDSLRRVADEVHTIITARDLARQVPAEWQQTIKHGRTHRLREFYDIIRSDQPLLFWRAQSLPDQVRTWGQGLPPEQVHLVTVPPAGAPNDALWTRFASVVGIDPDSVTPPEKVENLSLGLVEIETLRRVNRYSPRGTTKPLRQLMIRQVLGDGVLARRPDPRRFAPPENEHPWVVETGTAMVEELKTLSCEVVGDLDELLPPPEPLRGPVPDDVDDGDVAEVAIETISGILYGEHADAIDEVKRLRERIEEKNADIAKARAATQKARQELQAARAALQAARAALQAERQVPLWRHAARKVRAAGRALVPGRRS